MDLNTERYKLRERMVDQAERGIDRMVSEHARSSRPDEARLLSLWVHTLADRVVEALSERFTFRDKQGG